MNNIDISYPTWSIAIIILLALLLAAILYFRNTFEDRKPLTALLYVLRTMGILLILFLLLNPFISRSENEEQPARLIFLQDYSQSLFYDQDSMASADYQKSLSRFLESQSSQYPVDFYRFDQEVNALPISSDIPYDGQITDIDQALRFASDLHQADHVGAMVIATDGIYNRGANPAYFQARGDYPVYVLALGDTTPIQDIRIQQVLYNEIVRKNETSEIQVDITGQFDQPDAGTVTLQTLEGNAWRNVASERFQPNEDGDFFETITFHRKYENPGVVRMRVLITGIENDPHLRNNAREFFVEVLETAREIQIVSTFPHPDIGAFRDILESNDNNEVEVTLVEGPGDLPPLNEFNVLIFHQLPNVPYLIDFVKQALNQEKGVILTAGLKTNYSAFNEIQDLVQITPRTISGNEFNARVNPGFDLFEVDQEFEDYITRLPPLSGVFGEYTITGQGQALLLQQIGDVDTQFPIVFTGIQDGSRLGIFTVEGIWKWRLFEYFEKQETPVLNELIDKVVEFVSQKKDERLFRLQKNKLLFDETEEISFQAELYNETLERINHPDVFFELRDSSGNRSEYTFDKTTNGYYLNLGRMAPGQYSYRAHTSTGGQDYEETGHFSVRDIDLESYNLQANHQDLYTMTVQNNGQMFYDFESLETALNTLPTMKPLLVESQVKTAMIDWKWIFGLILMLFTAEWVIRRYFGSY